MKVYKGQFEIYDTARIYLILCDNIPQARNQFKDIRDGNDSDDCRGLAIYRWPNYYIFFKESTLSKRLISHEVFHIVVYLMKDVGVRFGTDNNEPFAYMIEWLTGWVYTKLGSRKIPTNKRLKKL